MTDETGKVISESLPEIKTYLDQLTHLPENWDSYGGIPVTREAAETAKKIVDALSEHNWQVFPISDGGVLLCCYEKGHEIELEVSYEGLDKGGTSND